MTTQAIAASKPLRLLLILAPWMLILLLWYGVRASGLVSPALVPAPHEVATRFAELLRDRLAVDIFMSTRRVLIGVALGVALAAPRVRRRWAFASAGTRVCAASSTR
jgi:NitT/TauT family transport system permease protein